MNPEQNYQNNGQLPPQGYQQPPVAPNQPPQSPMQMPQNPGPGMPGHNPYEFIMNPGQPQKKSFTPGGGSMLQRIAIFGGGLVFLIVAALVFMSVLSSGGKDTTADFLAIAQQQTELIRVGTAGTTQATTLPAQNLAQNVQATVTSQKTELLAYLKTSGVKIDAKLIGAKASKATDDTLAAAKANSTYDTAFTAEIQTELTAYMIALEKAYKLNPGPNGQKLLAGQYDAAKLLKSTATN